MVHVPDIPLVDLGAQHREVAEEVTEGFARVLEATSFINGDDVVAFESEFAAFCETEHCIGVANGTDALELALRAMGLGAGDEVIVPANTFVASAEAIARAGGRPVFVDCEPDHLLLDVAQVADRIGPRTRAVMAVDLFGQVAPMELVAEVADGAGIALVEDAAQAQGASRRGRMAGSFGVAAGTSFYPGKNLGAYGDAGAVLTDSDEVASRVRDLRNHGGENRYQHNGLGFNSRLDTLQAVVLRAKLRRLAGWNKERQVAAARYDELLADLPEVRRPGVLDGNEHVWHLYVLRVPGRDEVLRKLRAAGVGAAIHYPTPVHLQPAFLADGPGPGAFPVAEDAARRILTLPMFPGITEAQQERVTEVLRAAMA